MDKLGKLVNVQVSARPLWERRFDPWTHIYRPVFDRESWATAWVHIYKPVSESVWVSVGDRVRDRVMYAD